MYFAMFASQKKVETLTRYKGMQGHQLSQELSKDRNKEQLK
jgi:hypothetical protein